MRPGSRRAVLAALLANLGVAVAKFAGYLATGAASLLAEAVHSVADSGNQLLLLLGAARAARPATPEHPFGYGRERYFWAFMVAVVLFTLGSLFAINEGLEKLRHPHALASAEWAIGILLVAIALEANALRTAVAEANAVRGGLSWWAFVRRAKTPELPVILLEDFGALVGLTIALVCIALAAWTGDARWDAAGSLGIGALLGAIALLLGYEMKSLLIGESASARIQAEIRATIESHPRVRRLIHLRTQHLGPEELLVGAKVELDDALSFPEVAATIDDLERTLRTTGPARVIYLEPDVERAVHEPSGTSTGSSPAAVGQAPDEEQEFEGVFVAHWEVARFAVIRGRRLFGLVPRVELWLARFPSDFTLPHPVSRHGPGHCYRMRVRGQLGPRGHFGHRGICVHELLVSEVLACEETDQPGPTW